VDRRACKKMGLPEAGPFRGWVPIASRAEYRWMLDRIAQRLRCSRAGISDVSESFQAASAQPECLLSGGQRTQEQRVVLCIRSLFQGVPALADQQTISCWQYFANVTK
jgi:hypothetical protein